MRPFNSAAMVNKLLKVIFSNAAILILLHMDIIHHVSKRLLQVGVIVRHGQRWSSKLMKTLSDWHS